MDIYELREEMGHSGFGSVQIMDSASYDCKRPNGGYLFVGDLEDTRDLDCSELDNSEITSIDIDYEKKVVTIDIDFGGVESYVDLSKAYEDSGMNTPLGLNDLEEYYLEEGYDWEI